MVHYLLDTNSATISAGIRPAASLRSTCSTVTRVPRMTGLPNITSELISMRSWVMDWACLNVARQGYAGEGVLAPWTPVLIRPLQQTLHC